MSQDAKIEQLSLAVMEARHLYRQKREELDALAEAMKAAESAYAEACCPFKIGEVVQLDGGMFKQGVVVGAELDICDKPAPIIHGIKKDGAITSIVVPFYRYRGAMAVAKSGIPEGRPTVI